MSDDRYHRNIDRTMTFQVTELEVSDVIAETEKAIRIVVDDTEYWCPLSAISEDSEVQGVNDSGTLSVSRWWATKEGLLKSVEEEGSDEE